MTTPAFEYALTFARRRIREGDLPRQAGQDAADYYSLTKLEAFALVEQLEAEPSAGRETTLGEPGGSPEPHREASTSGSPSVDLPLRDEAVALARIAFGTGPTLEEPEVDGGTSGTEPEGLSGSSGGDAARASAIRKDAGASGSSSVALTRAQFTESTPWRVPPAQQQRDMDNWQTKRESR